MDQPYLFSDQHRANSSKGKKDKKRSAETCAKITKALKGKKRGPYTPKNLESLYTIT
jgi:hypothetical protein